MVETLSRAGGFSVPKVRRGLLETAQHTLHATHSPDSMRPGGAGHVSTVRVRLLHAIVRDRILQLARERPSYYNFDACGIPVNYLDSIGTISSFAATVVWVGLPRQRIHLSEQESADYIALWRLVAYYIGAPTDAFGTPRKARAMMESIMLSEITPSQTGGVLARNMIDGLANMPPLYASRGVLETIVRWLNGKSLSDELGIGNPGLFAWFVATSVFLYAMLRAYISRSIPILDAMQIEVIVVCLWVREALTRYITVQSSKRKFRSRIMDVKTGLANETKFMFKYIPKDPVRS